MKLFIYSDGLIEARNQYGHMYGDENLKKFVIKNIASPNKEFKKKLFSQIDIFMGDSPLVDDITILLINFLK